MYELGKIDKLSYIPIKYGKIIAFLLMLLFLTAIVVGVTRYFEVRPEAFRTPVYEDYQPYLGITGERAAQQDFSEIDTRIEIEEDYDNVIKSILMLGNFDSEYFFTIVDWMIRVPDHRRSRFIYGLEEFLTDYSESLAQDTTLSLTPEEKTELFTRMATTYKSIFYDLLDKESQGQSEATQRQTIALIFIGIALLLFMVALSIPVLLKIEENSRLFR
ncbi:MAG: hypothetical protein D6E12_12345 [Desulfovibrio sp.]|nr:MAG: hypothetical protein D6E12_12345 [Desulfovibrio sp.]